MKDGITVIIPCYNVEKYLRKSVESIQNQTYKNLEIILVDDCSSDDTINIIKELESEFSNVKALYNEKNLGAGASRNRALAIAKYNCISFIDSDDYIEDNYYESMIQKMKKDKADVVVCDIFVRYENSATLDIRSCACETDNIKKSVINNGLAASPCNKLFRKQDLQKFPFQEGIMNEDVATVFPILYNAKKISYVEDTFYNYVQRTGSVQNDSISDKRFDIFKAIEILEERTIPYNQKDSFWEAIIHNQIITFFLYVLTKEPNYFKRVKLLKKYYHLSKKYKIRQNHLLWTLLEMQGTKHKYYYKTLLKLNDNGLSMSASACISFYRWYSKKLKATVIKSNIKMDDLVDAAKMQSNLKPSTSISVVVPNYNYEKFLFERIYSILNQKVKITELLILDDCSKDNSRELIDEIEKTISPYVSIKKVYNTDNSGSAFKQWRKGFEMATGELIWIAEADDYCDSNFLKRAVKPMKNDKDVVLSYTDTAFIDKDGQIILTTIKPEIDIMKTKHWNKNYVNDGTEEVKKYAYLNCTIANVSSVIFRNADYTNFFEASGKYKQAGDWLFYINIMLVGKVAFYNKALNYYRVHGNNVTSTTKKQAHFDEIKRVHEAIDKKITLTKSQKKIIKGRYNFLQKVWKVK